eukprot:gene2276-8544_t
MLLPLCSNNVFDLCLDQQVNCMPVTNYHPNVALTRFDIFIRAQFEEEVPLPMGSNNVFDLRLDQHLTRMHYHPNVAPSRFDIFIRAQFEEEVPLPMGSNNVFDLCLDDSVNFMISQWEDIVPRFKYNPTLPYFQILVHTIDTIVVHTIDTILVHTIDTVRYSFLLETCLEVNRAVLFNGGSGVGKSAIVHDTLSRLQAEGAAAKDLVDGPRHYMPVVLNFSAQTSSKLYISAACNSSSTQASFEACLERKRKKLFGAPAGRHIVLFVDDLNMPAREVYGAQPPNELLRQFLDFSEMAMRTIFSAILGGFLESHFGADVSHRMLKTMVDSSVDVYLRISQELLPTPTKSHYTFNSRDVSKVFQGELLPTRTKSHYTFNLKDLSKAFQGLLNICPCTELLPTPTKSHYTFNSRGVSKAFQGVLSIRPAQCPEPRELLPTPTKSHYTFNLRDVSKVFQGVLNIRPAQCPEPRVSLARLWVHENMRVFHDRLTDSDDKEFGMREKYENLFVDNTILFGDYMHMGTPLADRKYEEISDLKKLNTLLGACLNDFNSSNKKSPLQLGECVHNWLAHGMQYLPIVSQLAHGMQYLPIVSQLAHGMQYLPIVSQLAHGMQYLPIVSQLAHGMQYLPIVSQLAHVFFMDAIQHISRIARVIRQPRGSAMLVGVGGSGKQTLTRFACFMSKTECVSIELTRNYGLNEFREQLRSLYMTTGVEKMHVAFLFTDNHIVSESFVEDINSVLNSGEITGLFASDEVERALTKLRDTNIDDEDMVNETRGGMFLSSQDLGGKEVNSAVSNACVAIHISVIAMSDLFYEELRRRSAWKEMTPKSYAVGLERKDAEVIRRVVVEEEQEVAKQSKAAMSMCLWVRAMDTYSKVVKVVEPKRNILKVAQINNLLLENYSETTPPPINPTN